MEKLSIKNCGHPHKNQNCLEGDKIDGNLDGQQSENRDGLDDNGAVENGADENGADENGAAMRLRLLDWDARGQV